MYYIGIYYLYLYCNRYFASFKYKSQLVVVLLLSYKFINYYLNNYIFIIPSIKYIVFCFCVEGKKKSVMKIFRLIPLFNNNIITRNINVVVSRNAFFVLYNIYICVYNIVIV